MKKKKVDYYRILAILIVICGIIYFYCNIFAPKLIPKTLRIGTLRRPTNILVVGTDLNFDIVTRKQLKEMDGRTDSILLLHFDPVRYKLSALSIPRDSFVMIPGYGMQKINAANVYGGIGLTEQTISNLTGLHIDGYISIDPSAVVKLVDLIGGVTLYVEKDLYYTDRAQKLYINLKQGWRRLSGIEAQGYIRFRHDATGDIGRIERQQKFMQTLFQSFASPSNLLRAPLAIDIAMQNIKTDLPLSQLIRLTNFARMLSMDELKSFTAPGEVGESSYAGSIVNLNKPELDKIIRDYFSR
jgi:LCP family protein required for cell wall assembly